MDKDVWSCEECKAEFPPTMAGLRAHLKEKHPQARLKRIETDGRVGWTTEPLTDLELSNMEASALRNTERSGSDGDEFCDFSEYVFDLLDEVRRLRSEVVRFAGDPMVPLEELHEARRAERERIARAFEHNREGTGPRLSGVGLDDLKIAAAIRALPEE